MNNKRLALAEQDGKQVIICTSETIIDRAMFLEDVKNTRTRLRNLDRNLEALQLQRKTLIDKLADMEAIMAELGIEEEAEGRRIEGETEGKKEQ